MEISRMGDDFKLSLSDLDLEDINDPMSITYNSGVFSDSNYVTDSGSEYTFNVNVSGEEKVFENTMPSVTKINNMCKHYPALAKAYENFKTIYKMVEQDYKGNHEEEDNDVPF